jgi:cytochrome c peroxidase
VNRAGRLVAAIVLSWPVTWPAAADGAIRFNAQEKAAILSHGPWPLPAPPDISNRLSGQPEAIAFGRRLFFDPRLSAGRDRSCASCHDPGRAFTDGVRQAVGTAVSGRNTPTVVDARFQRWFGWGGASDSLWSASLRPLADGAEMGASERVVAQRVRDEPDLARSYRKATGRLPPADDDVLLADVGKSLAAFQETLVSPRTPFDTFRDGLARGDRSAIGAYPPAAQRGLKLFVGAARCATCHSGPLFTHLEFDRAGIPVRNAGGHFDWGRHDGVKALRSSRFNLLSTHNDDASGRSTVATRHASLDAESYGAFRVPGLRNLAATAPYMHDGSLPTLESVVRHYASLDEVALHIASAHGHPEPGEPLPPRPTRSILGSLKLTEAEVADLTAFLLTLSAPPSDVATPTRDKRR